MTFHINCNQNKFSVKRSNSFYCSYCKKEIKLNSKYHHFKTSTHKMLLPKYNKSKNLDINNKLNNENKIFNNDNCSYSSINCINEIIEQPIIEWKK